MPQTNTPITTEKTAEAVVTTPVASQSTAPQSQATTVLKRNYSPEFRKAAERTALTASMVAGSLYPLEVLKHAYQDARLDKLGLKGWTDILKTMLTAKSSTTGRSLLLLGFIRSLQMSIAKNVVTSNQENFGSMLSHYSYRGEETTLGKAKSQKNTHDAVKNNALLTFFCAGLDVGFTNYSHVGRALTFRQVDYKLNNTQGFVDAFKLGIDSRAIRSIITAGFYLVAKPLIQDNLGQAFPGLQKKPNYIQAGTIIIAGTAAGYLGNVFDVVNREQIKTAVEDYKAKIAAFAKPAKTAKKAAEIVLESAEEVVRKATSDYAHAVNVADESAAGIEKIRLAKISAEVAAEAVKTAKIEFESATKAYEAAVNSAKSTARLQGPSMSKAFQSCVKKYGVKGTFLTGAAWSAAFATIAFGAIALSDRLYESIDAERRRKSKAGFFDNKGQANNHPRVTEVVEVENKPTVGSNKI